MSRGRPKQTVERMMQTDRNFLVVQTTWGSLRLAPIIDSLYILKSRERFNPTLQLGNSYGLLKGNPAGSYARATHAFTQR